MSNITTVAPASTFPLASKIATQTLDDTFEAGVSTIVDASGARAKTLAITAGGAAKVDGSAVTHPVSLATVPSHPVTNAGTFAVQIPKAATPTQTSVPNAVTTTSLLAANADRLGATIFNDDTASTGAVLKVKLGATASASSFSVAIAPQGYYEVPFGYTGAVDGIASAATGNARITELV